MKSLNSHKLGEVTFWTTLVIILVLLGVGLYINSLPKLKLGAGVSYPDPKRTPGKLIDNLDINKTICNSSWRTGEIRPPSSYTSSLKIKQMKEYGFTGSPSAFEEDHVCSLTNGGDPVSPLNLWPQTYLQPGAREKDKLELSVHKLICEKKITPLAACKRIANNWYQWYQEVFKGKLGSETVIDTDDE